MLTLRENLTKLSSSGKFGEIRYLLSSGGTGASSTHLQRLHVTTHTLLPLTRLNSLSLTFSGLRAFVSSFEIITKKLAHL